MTPENAARVLAWVQTRCSDVLTPLELQEVAVGLNGEAAPADAIPAEIVGLIPKTLDQLDQRLESLEDALRG